MIRKWLYSIALSLLLIAPLSADKTIPPGMNLTVVPIRAACTQDLDFMLDVLWMEWGELPAYILELAPIAYAYITTNEDNTKLSWVFVRTDTEGNILHACMIWSGQSKQGNAIQPMLKPDASVLPPRTKENPI